MTKEQLIAFAIQCGANDHAIWVAAEVYGALVNAGYEIVPAVENYGRFQGNDDN